MSEDHSTCAVHDVVMGKLDTQLNGICEKLSKVLDGVNTCSERTSGISSDIAHVQSDIKEIKKTQESQWTAIDKLKEKMNTDINQLRKDKDCDVKKAEDKMGKLSNRAWMIFGGAGVLAFVVPILIKLLF